MGQHYGLKVSSAHCYTEVLVLNHMRNTHNTNLSMNPWKYWLKILMLSLTEDAHEFRSNTLLYVYT